MRLPVSACGAASACALMASACAGDDVVDRCVERFNSPSNQTREFVTESAPVWLGESKENPDKCVAVVVMDSGAFILLRENVKPGTWVALSNVTGSEGSDQELVDHVNHPVAVGKADGTIEAK